MRVYHYMKGKYALEAIQSEQLKLSRISDMNDPLEFRGFNIGDRDLRRRVDRWVKKTDQELGFICFSSTMSVGLMWSHYADSHRGVVLGFEIPQKRLIKIKYSPYREPFEEAMSAGEAGAPNQILRNRMVKHESWEYEDEWRYRSSIVKRRPNKKSMYFEGFEHSMELKEVWLGERFREASSIDGNPTIEEFQAAIKCLVNDVALKQTRLAFTKFKVVEDRSTDLLL